MSTLTINSTAQASASVAPAASSLLAMLNRAVHALFKPSAAVAAVDRAAGVRQLRRLARKFDQIDPAQAAELRWLAGRG